MTEGPTEATGGDRRDRRRLTVPEAATVLGVTVDAVRGRIRRGRLESEHDDHGGVYVLMEAEGADRRGPSETGQGPSTTGDGPSPDESRLVEVLEDQVGHLREQLAAEREANRENRRLLAAALERIPAIEAPDRGPREPESASEAPTPTETPEPQTEAKTTAQRPWWLRWLGG